MRAQAVRTPPGETRIKKQIFSLLILYKRKSAAELAWGVHYPKGELGSNLHKPSTRLPPAFKPHHYKNNNGNHEDHQKKAGVEARAENISRQLATGQCKHHQNDAECN